MKARPLMVLALSVVIALWFSQGTAREMEAAPVPSDAGNAPLLALAPMPAVPGADPQPSRRPYAGVGHGAARSQAHEGRTQNGDWQVDSGIPQLDTSAPNGSNGHGRIAPGAVFGVLSDVFDQEVRDPSWTATARRELEDVIASEGLDAELVQLECRTSLCRVEVSFPDTQAAADLHDLAPVARDAFIVDDLHHEDGTVRTSVLFARPGSPLRPPPPGRSL